MITFEIINISRHYHVNGARNSHNQFELLMVVVVGEVSLTGEGG